MNLYSLHRNEVEDAVLEGRSLDFFDYFFETKGTAKLMFYYQEVDIPTPEGGKSYHTYWMLVKGKVCFKKKMVIFIGQLHITQGYRVRKTSL